MSNIEQAEGTVSRILDDILSSLSKNERRDFLDSHRGQERS